MHVRNWISNSLDTSRRREAVRQLGAARSRVAKAMQGFRQIQKTYSQLCERMDTFEREGASPRDLFDWYSTYTSFARLQQEHTRQLQMPLDEFNWGWNFRTTPENAFFAQRLSACAGKLEQRVNAWKAREMTWTPQMTDGLNELVNRLGKLKPWHKMTGVEFENFIIDKLRKRGFAAQPTKASGDEGIDIVAVWQGKPSNDDDLIANLSRGRKYLIQCKRYDAQSAIGQPMLREFYGSMKAMDATADGIFITTSRFTDSAVEYATRMGIHLIDGSTLDKVLSQHA